MDIKQNVIGSVSLSYLIVFLTHLYNLYLNENEAQEILLNPGGEIGCSVLDCSICYFPGKKHQWPLINCESDLLCRASKLP